MRQIRLFQKLITPAAVIGLAAGLLVACGAGTPNADGRPGSPPSSFGSQTPSGGSAGATPAPGVTDPGLPEGQPTTAVPPGQRPPGQGPGNPAPSATGTPSGAELTVTGDVEDGVEPNCLILRTTGQSYLLLGGDRSVLRSGARVTVRGNLVVGIMTTCQQGRPLRVVAASGA